MHNYSHYTLAALAFALTPNTEMGGFLEPGESHRYMAALPMGTYELELEQTLVGIEAIVSDQFDEILGSAWDIHDYALMFVVPGRELITLEVVNRSDSVVRYSAKINSSSKRLEESAFKLYVA